MATMLGEGQLVDNHSVKGIVSKAGGDQKESSREDEDKVENIILEFC